MVYNQIIIVRKRVKYEKFFRATCVRCTDCFYDNVAVANDGNSVTETAHFK